MKAKKIDISKPAKNLGVYQGRLFERNSAILVHDLNIVVTDRPVDIYLRNSRRIGAKELLRYEKDERFFGGPALDEIWEELSPAARYAINEAITSHRNARWYSNLEDSQLTSVKN